MAPDLWADPDDTWYAALIGTRGEAPYGLARRVPGPGGVVYQTFDQERGLWATEPDPLSIFTGIGGVNDAVAVDARAASRILRDLGGGAL